MLRIVETWAWPLNLEEIWIDNIWVMLMDDGCSAVIKAQESVAILAQSTGGSAEAQSNDCLQHE